MSRRQSTLNFSAAPAAKRPKKPPAGTAPSIPAAAAPVGSNNNKKQPLPRLDDNWRRTDCGTMLFLYPTGALPSAKVAAFDIDWTVIRTKSGKTFATNERTDWELWSDRVGPKIRELVDSGYRIVFCSNQEGIGKGKIAEADWTAKVDAIVGDEKKGGLGLANRVTVMASLTKKANDFRKPHAGMWRFLSTHLSGGGDDAAPAASESLYCGDAAGRPRRGKGKTAVKKDFSSTDIKFARNVGLEFHTPEMMFRGQSESASLAGLSLGFEPKKHWAEHRSIPTSTRASISNPAVDRLFGGGDKIVVIVVVGSPASGKSTLSDRLVAASKNDDAAVELVRVNQDTLKTLPKCVKAARGALAQGKSVIVDNTNRDKKTRQHYFALAKELGVPCRCLWLTTTKEESFHLNAYRASVGPGELRSVPDMVIHGFYKNVEAPTVGEGFSNVCEIPFVPGPFVSEEQRNIFFQFMQ